MNDATPKRPPSVSWQRLRRWAKANAVGPASSALSKVGLMVSRSDVLWCYRHLLGREPESEDAVLSHLRFRSFRALARHFVESAEYSGRRAPATAARRPGGRQPDISAEVFRTAIEASLQGKPASKDRDTYITTHQERLLHTINVIGELLPGGGRMVDYSAARFFSDALRTLQPSIQQTSVSGVNFERDDYVARFGRGQYDLCLNTEVLEHLLFDPAHMVCAINGLLKSGGLLYLTTPNALSMVNALQLMQGSAPTLWNQVKPDEPYYERHNREWTPFEVVKLLEEHSFEILEVYTEDFYGSSRRTVASRPQQVEYIRHNSTHDYFGDTLCVVARKRSAIKVPVRSAWLYAFHERPAKPAEKQAQARRQAAATAGAVANPARKAAPAAKGGVPSAGP